MDIYGAIIGDIVGSVYKVLEFNDRNKGVINIERRLRILDKNTPLLVAESSISDDTILTCAIADATLKHTDYVTQLRKVGLQEESTFVDSAGNSKFDPNFIKWLHGENIEGSGNEGATRISAVGYAFDTIEQTVIECEKATKCTYNNLEAIKCAKAVAGSIFLLRNGQSKELVKSFCEKMMCAVDFNLPDLQRHYFFRSKAMESVPQAIFCFLEGSDFEDVLRKSISIGGDSGAIASIACSLASAVYPIPEQLLSKVRGYIPEKYLGILDNFNGCLVKNK